MAHNKVIILVAADGEEYQDLVQAIRDTWGAAKINGFEILYYYGYRENYPTPQPGECVQCNDVLVCGVGREDINGRNQAAFGYIYRNFDFEYLFRCCAGSYIHQGRMAEFLQDKPQSNFYCGRIGQHTVDFASGSGFFLSKDLIKLLVDDPSAFTCHRFDDVGFGMFFATKGITVSNAPRQDFDHGIIDSDLEENQYHFHFRKPASLMYEVHRRLV